MWSIRGFGRRDKTIWKSHSCLHAIALKCLYFRNSLSRIKASRKPYIAEIIIFFTFYKIPESLTPSISAAMQKGTLTSFPVGHKFCCLLSHLLMFF